MCCWILRILDSWLSRCGTSCHQLTTHVLISWFSVLIVIRHTVTDTNSWTFKFHKVVRKENSGAVEDFILPYSAVDDLKHFCHWTLLYCFWTECAECLLPGHICHIVTGECVCPPLTEGIACERCQANSWGHDPLAGCKVCSSLDMF